MKVNILRMSIFQIMSLPSLIPAAAPAGFWQTPDTYAGVFQKAPLSGAGPGWQKPWPTVRGQRFWERYLEKSSLVDISGKKAWRKLVPLHQKVLGMVAIASPLPVSVAADTALEGFVYPHALATIFTVTLYLDELPLAAAVDSLVEVRRQCHFAVIWPDQSTTDSLSLDGLLSAALDRVQRLALDNELNTQASTLSLPFTITTVLKASFNKEENLQIKPGDEIHHALHAMCNPKPDWRDVPLNAHDWQQYAKLTPGQNHVIYAREHGRAVWFPEQFAERSAS
jgi:hypothetical protein